MIILIIWSIVLIAVIILYFRQINSRFTKYGVKYITPIPLLGNMTKILTRQIHFADDLNYLYKSFPEERFVGRFEFISEQVIIRDLDLVKQITVKDFEYFLDHRSIIGSDNSFFSRTLFALQGQEWKDMRSTLSPAFTSSKIRVMVPLMIEVGNQMIADLKRKLQNAEYIDVDCKDMTTRYANDVIASCAFGLSVDSLKDPDNEFFATGRECTSFSFQKMIKFFLMLNQPKLSKLLQIDLLSAQSKEFFRSLVTDTMKDRELKNIIRPDMIHLLMEVKKGRLTHDNDKKDDVDTGFATVEESAVGTKKVNREWSDTDFIAQAVLFFLAGFESASSGICFLLYELAVNTDVQDKLAKEIKEHDEKNGGTFDFKSIQSMTYMDMVVSEALRLWPPAVALDRQCTKDYNLGKPNKNSTQDFIIRKGTTIGIPAYAFHRDPEHFPNPEKFDPERFSEENKHNINPFAYMPFGVGPRNCIGSRFALCEIKAITYQILLHMELSPSNNTVVPAQLARDTLSMRLKGGPELRFKLRS